MVVYKEVLITSISQRIAKSGGAYLSIRFNDGVYAQCWDKDMWSLIQLAHDIGKAIRLDLAVDEARDGSGRTFTHVVGCEHPDQMILPGVSP